ncbi:MAG: type III-B CRISPR module RAMP protein Cmr1 [Caldilineaceae bacterium]|nr:type III-B CRISPR module RAMP protein Cmr1 [Caldilineaceae bacterium]HRJ41873.1 type III-B CRISPR module RAMP protein Cmr1 [Caldilineaceae bacterium]
MNEPLEITLKTLTPLWTGGVETGRMDRVHETGILGSLRWWYEVVVRGLGGSACDPTGHSCLYDPDKPNQGICDVCRLFGATGWRRRFRLAINDADVQDTWSGGAINVKPPDRNRGWYLPAGQMGGLRLQIVADEKIKAQVLALLQFVERHGNFGARPQLGYGLCQIEKVSNDPVASYDWSVLVGSGRVDSRLPDLRTFTFFTLTFEPERGDWWRDVPGVGALARDNRYRGTVDALLRRGLIPITPALKNVLRYGAQWSSGALPHHFFGTLRGEERRRGRIGLSWAYRLPDSALWQMRGWAYPPQTGESQQREVAQRLQAVLGKPETWLQSLNIRYRQAEAAIAPMGAFFQPLSTAQAQQFMHESAIVEVQG